MKKILFFASAMSLVLASCNNDEIEGLTTDSNDNNAKREITISASMEENNEGDAVSRANYYKNGTTGMFFWTNDDKISVYSIDGNFYPLTITSGGSSYGTFTGEISGKTSTCAVYPSSIAKSIAGTDLTVTLPASYTYASVPTAFPTGMEAAAISANMPMIAKITTEGETNLAFKTLCGLFCFQFDNVPAGTSKIVFYSHNKINGDFTADLDAVNPEITTAEKYPNTSIPAEQKSITVNFPALASTGPVVIYIPLPSTTCLGFGVRMYDSSGNITAYLLSEKNPGTYRAMAKRYNNVTVNPVSDCEAVDLGLSVKWATFNIGATTPSKVGNYFAWGEPMTQYEYGQTTSLTYKISQSSLETEGIISADVLTPAFDAATANWGSPWRMPTQAEMAELVNDANCTWTWDTVDGVKGYTVTSKKTGYEGISIFLPITGYKCNHSIYEDDWGFYWASTYTDVSSNWNAYSLRFNSGSITFSAGASTQRYAGFAIRPVQAKP